MKQLSVETQRELVEVAYPFCRDTYTDYDEDGPFVADTWRPGVRYEMVQPDDSEAVADGVGKMIMEVVSRHKPSPFPERVFYTRRWIDPTGKEFGKRRLMIATGPKFRRLATGYRFEYRLAKARAEGGE